MRFFYKLAIIVFLAVPWSAHAGIEMGVVSAETANIYVSTSASSGTVSTLSRDTYIPIFSTTGKWYKELISTEGNQALYGWMKKEEVRLLQANERPEIEPVQ
jgi:predicted dinucleotide-binding enzyme